MENSKEFTEKDVIELAILKYGETAAVDMLHPKTPTGALEKMMTKFQTDFASAFIRSARAVFMMVEALLKTVWEQSKTVSYSQLIRVADKFDLGREVFIILQMIYPDAFVIDYPTFEEEENVDYMEKLQYTFVRPGGPMKGPIYKRTIDSVARVMHFQKEVLKVKHVRFDPNGTLEDNYDILSRFYSHRIRSGEEGRKGFRKLFMYLYDTTPRRAADSNELDRPMLYLHYIAISGIYFTPRIRRNRLPNQLYHNVPNLNFYTHSLQPIPKESEKPYKQLKKRDPKQKDADVTKDPNERKIRYRLNQQIEGAKKKLEALLKKQAELLHND